jgi:hypothetical protein
MKHKLLFISLIFFVNFSFSQEKDKIIPIHFIKLDVLKSAFCQLHFDYERYNGGHFGTELGFSVFYPNSVLSYLNEEGTFQFDRLACHYQGYGLELKQKFYFPKKHWNLYFAPQVSFKYKYFNNESIYIVNGFRSSSDSFSEKVSSRMYVKSFSLMAGMLAKANNNLAMDFSAGVGLGYFETLTTLTIPGAKNELDLGHHSFYFPVIKLGIKICVGWSRK